MKMIFLQLIMVGIAFYFTSFKGALMTISIMFLKFVWDLGLFSSLKIYTGSFLDCEYYYKEYQGEYKNIGNNFCELNSILKKFKLENNENYSTMGIYYDSPEKIVDLQKSRALFGIKRINIDDKDKTQNSFEEFLIEKGFKKSLIPFTNCLISSFVMKYKIAMLIGIQKFYSLLKTSLKNVDFKRQYNIKEEVGPAVEVYSENEIKFFIPIRNIDKFNLITISQPQYRL